MNLESTDCQTRRVVLDSTQLSVHPESVGAARRFVRQTLTTHGITSQTLDAMVLLVSELATNVVVHAKTDAYPMMLISVLRYGAMLRLEVHDVDEHHPQPRTVTDQDETGRGLAVVASLAERWGTVPTRAGKYVFCELPPQREHVTS
jgi:anti-sigma regulatory factor (Ser/Thr protein kinase)